MTIIEVTAAPDVTVDVAGAAGVTLDVAAPVVTLDVAATTVDLTLVEAAVVVAVAGPSAMVLDVASGAAVTVIGAAAVGPPGASGPPGTVGGHEFRTAAVTLSGHRLVVARPDGTLEYADAANATHRDRTMWLTLGATAAGDLAEIVSFGEVTEPTWAWTPGGALFVGLAGQPTQTAPTSPAVFCRQVGDALTATTVFVDPQPPIVLAS